MVVLVRVAAEGRGLIYTSASFSGQSDFVSQKFCICVNTVVTKSACPTAAEKRLSASICLCRRCRSQPLPSVSRKQRYNTLDFPSWLSANSCKIVCQQGCCSPLLETQSQGDIPITKKSPRAWIRGNPEPRGYSPMDTPCFLRRLVPKL